MGTQHWFLLVIFFGVSKVTFGAEFLQCVENDHWFFRAKFDCAALEKSNNHIEAFDNFFDSEDDVDAACRKFKYQSYEHGYEVYFKNCQLNNMPQNFFRQIDKVDQIHLEHSGVQKIERENFQSTFRTRFMTFSQNNITELPALLFANVPEIRVVDFSYNQIRKIDPIAFNATKSYVDLIQINLSYNQIETLHEKVFAPLFGLNEIDLSYNRLEAFQPDMTNLVNLEKLILNNNRITQLSCNIFPNTMRFFIKAIFDISKNQLKQIDLNCEAHKINDDPLILNIQENFLEELTMPASKLVSNLSVILADGNKIEKISIEDELRSLKSFNLSRNNFRNVSDLLDILRFGSSLETLDLSFNDIRELGINSFVKLARLQDLYLNNINLSEIQTGTLSHSKNLKLLDLSHNNLNQFSFDVFLPNSKKLEKLYLNDNSINDFVGLPNILPNLNHLNILNNNLSCGYLSQFIRAFGSANIWLQPEPTLEPNDNRPNVGGVVCNNYLGDQKKDSNLETSNIHTISSCISLCLREK